jgi:parallel beta-helix repeat protein/YD repeat-containing protein
MLTRKAWARFLAYLLVLAVRLSSFPFSNVVPPAQGSAANAAAPTTPVSGDHVVPTTQWVNFYGLHLTINGKPAPPGTQVRAFDPRGRLAGEAVVTTPGTYGLLPAYGDVSSSLPEPGLHPGEAVTFTVNDQPATVLGPAAAVWTANGDLKQIDLAVGAVPPAETPHTVYFPSLGGAPGTATSANPAPIANPTAALVGREDASATTVFIPLSAGWNLVSFPVTPTNPSLTVAFASIAGLYSSVLSFNGGALSYYPNLPPSMNTLQTVDASHGYWINMTSPGTLAISGRQVGENQPIQLASGWNLVGYFPRGAEPVTTALAGVLGQVTAVLGYDGGALSYYPSLPPGINTLNQLDVDHGYWIDLTSPATLTYPSALATATPLPTSTPILTLPNTPTPVPPASPTPTTGPNLTPVVPPSIISSSTVWTAGLYEINGTVTVNAGITLTIQSGVTVKFNNFSSLIVNGTLIANGAPDSPIVFTSYRDDAFAGDTDIDGGVSPPAPGDWGNLYFGPTSVNDELSYALVRYGGTSNCCGGPNQQPASVYVSGASPIIDHLRIEFGTSYGLLLANSANPTVTNSLIDRIGVNGVAGNGIQITTSSAPTLQNNVLSDNSGYAIHMDSNTAPHFSGNLATNNGGNGVEVSGTIAPSESWDSDLPYIVDGGITVNPGITLTLQPGAILKFTTGQGITVNGTLSATGAITNPITLTSYRDDSVGGDSNDDGSLSNPAPGDWQGLTFNSSSVRSNLSYLQIRYGGSGYNSSADVTINGSAPAISNSQISFSSQDGLSLTNVALPTIANVTIANNNRNGMTLATGASPTLSGNGFVNNGNFAIQMDGSCALSASADTASNNLYNAVGVSGAVTASATWPADLPYVVNGGVTINTGVALTLQPGVVVQFLSGDLLVNGVLQANGTTGNSIVFTSVYDTLSDQPQALRQATAKVATTTLGPGNWDRIEFASTSSGSSLNNVVVRYGGSFGLGSVYFNGSAPSLANSIIAYSSSNGLEIAGSSPAVQNDIFLQNAGSGVYATTFANPTLQNDEFSGNGQFGVSNSSNGVTLVATNNWWGSPTGPTISSNPGGTGDHVSNGVTYSPWLTTLSQPTPTPYPAATATPVLNVVGGTISANTVWFASSSPYVVNNTVTVNNGVSLTIQPGVVVKFQPNTGLIVNGALMAAGATTNPIVFTSFRDDQYGGDTNGDGARTTPGPGNWSGITLGSAASLSTLSNVLIRYASTGIQVQGSSPTITNSTISNDSGSAIWVTNAGAPVLQSDILSDNLSAGLTLSGSSPIVLNDVFVNNDGAAISMDANSLPNNAGSQAYYNLLNGIQVSGTAGTRGSWHNDLPYIVNGNVDVAVGVVLTIPPGTVVKLARSSLTVDGGLIANGTSTSPIVFTSLQDDSSGGDTNNDGGRTLPQPGDWSQLQFSASSLSVSSLTDASVTYGGVSVIGASPTFSNDLIAYSGGDGLSLSSLAAPTISNDVIQQNNGNGLTLTSGAAPVISNNQFVGNHQYAVNMSADCTPSFSGNTATGNQTNGVGVSGNASATTSWAANLPYVVQNVTINAGVTLTLAPGVVVKFTPGGSLTANGNLVAVGTSTNPIIFTSLKDDSASGDTNNDGPASTAAPGDWQTIVFTSASTASQLTHVAVRYGGGYYHNLQLNSVAVPLQNVTVSQSLLYGIEVDNASPTFNNVEVTGNSTGIFLSNSNATITNSNIHDNSTSGVIGSGSNPTITGTTINNDVQGLTLYGTSAPYPAVSGNTLANNSTYAASIEVADLPTFGSNTFVGTDGNGIWVGGGALTQNATLYPGGVYVLSLVTIEEGATLTIQPAAVVKFNIASCYYSCNYTGLLIRGGINASGSATNPIVFTSLYDDAAGGDTNGDGPMTAPSSGNWGGIYLEPTSTTSTLNQVTVAYAGFGVCDAGNCTYAGVALQDSNAAISNSTIANNRNAGVYLSGSSPSITNNSFEIVGGLNSQPTGIVVTASSFPTITGNTISSNSTGISVDDSSGGTISGNTFVSNPQAIQSNAALLPSIGANTASSLTGNGIWTRGGTISANATIYAGITYVLDQTTINAGTVLTAQPGAVIKFTLPNTYYCCYGGGNLIVNGHLTANGNSNQPITFTSQRDDTNGGDTNTDGIASSPAPGNWGGVYLATSDSNLSYVVLQYGGSGFTVNSTSYSALLVLNGVSPSVSNSTIAQSSGIGIQISNAGPNISNNNIWGNYYGIYTQNGATPNIQNNTIHNDAYYGVYNADPTVVVNAINNSWGDDSGPAPVGIGDAINYSCCTVDGLRTYYVAFDPWNGKTHWIQQNLGVLRQWIAYVAEPVNTATGNYTYDHEDLNIPGRGGGLVFHRYYNSQAGLTGSLGNNWTFNFGMSVKDEGTDVLVTNEDGRVDKYLPNNSGGYTPPTGIYAILSKPNGSFSLKRTDQTVYNFDGSGRLSTIVDRNGNTTILSYNGSNLATVTDPTGRALSFAYDGAGHLIQVTDPLGRTLGFTYDQFGNQSSSTDARAYTTTYKYDAQFRVLTITDPNDNIFVTNVYDNNGRVITQRDARLNNTTFSYSPVSLVTSVTDPRGFTTAYTYDAGLRLLSVTDAAGKTIQYGYDSNNNRTSVTDRRGNVTHYAYDAMGNTTQINDPLSGVTSMTYDTLNDLKSRTDALNHTTTNTYDANGNLLQTVDAASDTTTFAYDSTGLLISTTDPNGYPTTYGYDAYGNRTSTTDPYGNVSKATFDIAGRKTTTTDALGNETQYTYDLNNDLLTTTDPKNGVTTKTHTRSAIARAPRTRSAI